MFDAYHGYDNERFFGGGLARLEYQRIAGQWYDNKVGMNLYKFSMSRPCSPSGLVREIQVAIDGLTPNFDEKWEGKLRKLLALAEKIVAHDRAVKAMEKAIKHAYALGIDPGVLHETHCRAMREGEWIHDHPGEAPTT